MRTDPSWTVVPHSPALLPSLRRSSNGMKGVLAALAVMLVSFGTSAVAGDGPYVGIGGSLSILNDSAVTAPAREPYTPLNINATTDNGFAVRGMAGYAFPSGLRVEAEIDYRKHNTDKMDVISPGGIVTILAPGVAARVNGGLVAAGLPARYADPANTTYDDLEPDDKRLADGFTGTRPVKGNFSMLAFMANVDYDFDTGSRGNPMSAAAWGSLLFRSIRSHKQPAGRSSTTTISSSPIRWVQASATSFPCRRAVRSPSAWTGDISIPRPRPSKGT